MGSLFPGGILAATGGKPATHKPIKIGQIGTGNQHAYKMATLRKLPELFEVVGIDCGG